MKKLLASIAMISMLTGCAVVHDPYYVTPVYPTHFRSGVVIYSPNYYPNSYVVPPRIIYNHPHYYRIR